MMTTTLATAVKDLSARLARLEQGASCPGDWARLDAAITRAALVARHELCGVPVEELDCEDLQELLDELRYIKLCTESRMFELAAER